VDVSIEVFERLKEALIEFKPKQTPYNQGGEGFDENNVLDIEATMPTAVPWDFVTFETIDAPATMNTVAHNAVTYTQPTFQIDAYAKRGGIGAGPKRAQAAACIETADFVTEAMASMGWNRFTSVHDRAYAENTIYRISMRFIRLLGVGQEF
jgi:hypothetical protein